MSSTVDARPTAAPSGSISGSAQLFPPDYRSSGLLLHVTSLPSPYGIGDLGAGAFGWIDHLHDAGQGWWQSLPLGPTGYLNSPYQPMSSFAGNGLLVSPGQLVLDGLLTAADCACDFPPYVVDYDAVIGFKHKLLETAWKNFGSGKKLVPEYEQFCFEQANWLEDYALFRALKDEFGGAYFVEWPEELGAARTCGTDRGAAQAGNKGRSVPLRAVSPLPPRRCAEAICASEGACA